MDTAPDRAPDLWDPRQYGRYAEARLRPFHDLLTRVPDLPGERPRVADLGCGTGDPTALLAARWSTASITGYDTSAAMLASAAAHAGPLPGGGSLRFTTADLADWRPDEPHDLIISNAALQWVPGVEARFPIWTAGLRPGGVLAFQVPGNFDAPAHRALRELCRDARWADRLSGLVRDTPPVRTPADYATALADTGCAVDVWETTYVHVLTGPDPVLEWMRGTGLRPVLAALAGEPAALEEFLAAYRDRLREAYPAGPHGTVFPFRRILAVARRPGTTARRAAQEARGATDARPAPATTDPTTAGGGDGPGFVALDHVQLPAPPGSEPELRAFYGGVLGMAELPKPPALAANGGCWFQSGDCQLHLGIETDHRPSGTAHPGVRVVDLPALVARLKGAGLRPRWDDRLPGHRRAFVHDPVGNRLEFLEEVPEDG